MVKLLESKFSAYVYALVTIPLSAAATSKIVERAIYIHLQWLEFQR
jgi:hypothetical protein